MTEADNILLVRWCQERDTEAFNVLVDRYGALVYGACLRILRDPDAASDAAQESFATLARKADPKIRSVPAWLHGVATKRSLNVVRSDSRRRARERQYSDLRESTTEPVWNDIRPLIDEAIDALPDRYKTVILAHYFDRQSHQDIAAKSGLARRTVTYRIQKGLELIRKRLARTGTFASTAHLGGLLGSQTPPLLPVAVSHGIGKLLISMSVTPATSGLASLSGLTGGWSMFAKIGIAALLVAAPFAFWKQLVPLAAEPEFRPAIAARPNRAAVPKPPYAVPVQLAVNKQDEQIAPNQFPPKQFAEAGATISVRIQKSGKPVSGQTIKLLDLSLYTGSIDEAVVAETELEMDSSMYYFSLYPPGRYAIVIDLPEGLYSAANPEHGQIFQTVEVVSFKNLYVVDVELKEATATLTGTLLIGGQPAPDISFGLYPFRERCTEKTPCVTDAAGHFAVDGLPPFKGDVQASLDHEDGMRQVSFLVPINLEPNASADAVFDFAWGNTSIEGAVYHWNNGVLKPVRASWDVFYQKIETDPDSGMAKGNLDGRNGDTDADGGFLIENLEPGHIVLSIWPEEGGSMRHRVTFDIADGVRYVKDIVLGENAITAKAINIPPTNVDLYFSVLPGAVDPLPDGITKDSFTQNFLHFDAMLMATSASGEFKGFMPGTYTVIAASWPCQAGAETARAMGDEFVYTFSVAHKVVNITGYKQTVSVVLDDFEFIPRPENKKAARN